MMTKKQREITSILLFIISVFMILSLVSHDPLETPEGIGRDIDINNWMGYSGVVISFISRQFLLGIFSIVLPLCLLLFSYTLFTNKIDEK